MKLTKINTIVALCLLLVFFSASRAEATQAPTLTVGNVTGAPGAIVNVPVNLLSQGEVAGIQFEVGYDSSLLSYQEASNGELTAGYLIMTTQDKGKVKLLITSLTGATIPLGNESVAQITFRVSDNAAPGQNCALDISGTWLSDAQGQSMEARVNKGHFNVDNNKVKADKTWTIHFNRPMDTVTMDQSIVVTDQYGNRQDVDISATDSTSVTVALRSGQSYKSGVTYTLLINTSLRSASGEYLKNPVLRQFSIE